MAERFAPVPAADIVFRLVDEGSSFLPKEAVLPLPQWFYPGENDVKEGEARGRSPGWSVWNKSVATVEEVKQLVDRPASRAFGLPASVVRAVGQQHGRALDVLWDPADKYSPQAGWNAHCVVEGLLRPTGLPRSVQKDLQTDLANQCTEHR